MNKVKLKDVCEAMASNIAQKDISVGNGDYPIYGASGFIGNVDFYKQEKPYIGIVKDGAGVGRAYLLPEKSSVIGTMQYILPKDNIDIKYLYYAIQYMHLEKYYSGATIPHIYFRDYQYEPILLPGKKEQEQKTNVLEKIDKLVFKHKKTLRIIDTLVKSRFIEVFGDPVTNPMGWKKMIVDDVCQSIVDCPHSTPHYTNEDTGYMCIRTSIVKKNRIMWDEVEYISKEEFEERIQRKKPERGDIVYTREGAILGIAAIIDRDCNVALGQRSMLLSPNQGICNSVFLSCVMNFDSFFHKVTDGVTGSALPHINVKDIKAFEIPLPPIELKNQFSDFVTLTDKSKQSIQQSIETLQIFKAKLMQNCFGYNNNSFLMKVFTYT